MSQDLRVSMLSNFGSPVRGVSPYSDMLADEIHKLNITLEKVDYVASYPSYLAPNASTTNCAKNAVVHYAKPQSWLNLAENCAELIHIQYWTSFSAYYLCAIVKMLHRRGKQVIITVHNPSSHETIPVFQFFERQLLKSVDHIVVHTEEGAKQLKKQLYPKSPEITVIPHGINVAHCSAEETVSTFNNIKKTPYILTIGNIRPYKGTDVLIDAWKTIHNNHPTCHLHIAGRLWGEDTSAFKKIISYILGSSKFSKKITSQLKYADHYNIIPTLRFLENTEINTLIKNALFVIFPYQHFSGQSGVAAIAAGFGTPILCSNIEGLTELAINDSFIVNNLTPDSLGRRINEKINYLNAHDRILQRRLAKEFSWLSVAKKHVSLYKQLINI